MKSLKGSAALICTIGIYTMGAVAYGAPDSARNHSQNSENKNTGLTFSMDSSLGQPVEKKDISPEVVLLEKPTGENTGQYITLFEPTASLSLKKPRKKLSVKHSFALKSLPMFNMSSAGLSSVPPSGYSGGRASAIGNTITFSYGNGSLAQDPGALGISIGSQYLVEPSRIMSPLFDGSEYDQVNNRQVYNLSVDMGYAGFRLGASFSQEKMLNDPGLRGFDVGLGYSGSKWGADVRFGEYKRERDRLFATTEEFYGNVSALEIGAAYQLFSNIRFTGRFTYYSYGHENSLDKLRSSQVFFLGTNVNF